ncbi:MAG: hypothetical protein WBK77_07875 [Alphaproteobacteria bacterium]
MSTADNKNAVNVTYEGNPRFQNSFSVAVQGEIVADVPVAFLQGLGQKIDDRNPDVLASYGEKILTPVFAEAYVGVDVLEIKREAFKPISVQVRDSVRSGFMHIEQHKNVFAQTQFHSGVAPYNDKAFSLLRVSAPGSAL